MSKLKLSQRNEPELTKWKAFLDKIKNPLHEVDIALVGKYVELPDAYKSIIEAFMHAGAANESKVNLHFIAAEALNKNNVASKLKKMHGVLVAPGFGERGLEGKLEAIRYARENQIPFLVFVSECSVRSLNLGGMCWGSRGRAVRKWTKTRLIR